MSMPFSTILLLSLFLYSSFANSDESATPFPVKGQICESVTHFKQNCGAHFYANADTRVRCCSDVKATTDDCVRQNFNQEERKSLSIAKNFCSSFDNLPQTPSLPPESSPSTPQTPSSPPESSTLPPETPSTPPEPSPLPPPPPQSTPDPTPHGKRPETCLVSTVLYDSCDPKYPMANSNGSTDERSYYPVNISTGFMTDGAGCCLGFAMFTNDCNMAIKDLSFANQKVFDSLQRSCTSPFHRP